MRRGKGGANTANMHPASYALYRFSITSVYLALPDLTGVAGDLHFHQNWATCLKVCLNGVLVPIPTLSKNHR